MSGTAEINGEAYFVYTNERIASICESDGVAYRELWADLVVVGARRIGTEKIMCFQGSQARDYRGAAVF